jgi:hypothetical protein
MLQCEDSYVIDNPIEGAGYLAAYNQIGTPPAWESLTPIITVHTVHDLSDYSVYHYSNEPLAYQTNFMFLFAIPAKNCSWTYDSYGLWEIYQAVYGSNWFPISSNLTYNPYWNMAVTTGIWKQNYNVYIMAGNTRVLLSGSNLQLGIKLETHKPDITTASGYINLTSDSYSLPMGSTVGNISYYVWDSNGFLIGELDDVNPTTGNISITIPESYSVRTVYFSAFSSDGLGVPIDTIRLYIDGNRYEWGPVTISQGIHHVIANDFFSVKQYDVMADLTTVFEWNVFLNMATLSLYNNDTVNYLTFKITKNDIPLLSQLIAPQNSLIFRFVAGLYSIEAYYPNGTLCASRKIALLTNSTESLSFGIYMAADINFTAADIIDPVIRISLITITVISGFSVFFYVFQRRSSATSSKPSARGKRNKRNE